MKIIRNQEKKGGLILENELQVLFAFIMEFIRWTLCYQLNLYSCVKSYFSGLSFENSSANLD